MAAVMADSPDKGSDGGYVGIRERGTALGRHDARIFFRIVDAIGDRPGDGGHARVATQPRSTGQVGADRGAPGVGAMAAAAGSVAGFAMKDPIAQRDLLGGGAGRR